MTHEEELAQRYSPKILAGWDAAIARQRAEQGPMPTSVARRLHEQALARRKARKSKAA